MKNSVTISLTLYHNLLDKETRLREIEESLPVIILKQIGIYSWNCDRILTNDEALLKIKDAHVLELSMRKKDLDTVIEQRNVLDQMSIWQFIKYKLKGSSFGSLNS